jgi:heme/copper-type cytochrome/quinol oxidase subunit 3
MKTQIRKWSPLINLVCVTTLIILLLDKRDVLEKKRIDTWVLLIGNFILFISTSLSFYVSQKSISSPNPNSSVRSLYGSFMIKFFLIAISAFIYILAVKKNVNKPALIICMGLYLVYTIIEVASLQKLLKQKKNA